MKNINIIKEKSKKGIKKVNGFLTKHKFDLCDVAIAIGVFSIGYKVGKYNAMVNLKVIDYINNDEYTKIKVATPTEFTKKYAKEFIHYKKS